MAENTIKTTNTVINKVVEIDDTYIAGTKVDITDADADDIRISGIGITNDNSVDRDLSLWIYDGANSYQLNIQTILDGAGTNLVDPPQDIMELLKPTFKDEDNAFNHFANIAAGFKLQVSLDAAPAVGKVYHIITHGAKYD